MLENQLTQENVQDMTPEQIIELQKQQCIFCKIVKGEIPAKKVYEDDICIAILDINPANLGHMLLIPKEHFTIMPQMPEDVVSHLAMISKQLSQSALKAFGAQGTNIFIANGAIAGQRAPHFMIHIIPRKEGDKVEGFSIPENKISDKDAEQIQKIIAEKLNSGGKIEEAKEEAKPTEVEVKKEEKPAEAEEKPEPKTESEETFITSSQAKRYHKKTCPFAQNIPKDKRIILTKEEVKNIDKKPCTCVSGKKIEMKKEKPATKTKEAAPVKAREDIVKKESEVDIGTIAKMFK